MSRTSHYVGFVIWLVVACFFVPSALADAKDHTCRVRKARHVPGELLIKYKHAARTAASRHRMSSRRFATLRRYRSVGIHRVKIPEGMTLDEALENCRQDPEVAYAEPNYVRQISSIPNDPDFGQLWGLDNLGQSGGKIDADIDAPEAWDIQTGSRDVVVAVLDTGIDWNHEDLAANIWTNPGEDMGLDGVPNTGDPGEADGIVQPEEENGVDDDNNGYVDDFRGWNFVEPGNNPDDDNGHGTHVSGTIGAEGDNDTGVVGVNWRVSIMPLKFLDAKGYGLVSDEIAAIDYAISHEADIINASYSDSGFSQAEYDAISRAKAAGILFVAAAGNSGTDNDVNPEYPAAYNLDNIIAVAATDHDDLLVSEDNKKWDWGSNFGAISVDVGAPGVQIYSTSPDDEYDEKSGTSMAAPHVSGLAALIWSVDSTLQYDEVKGFICNGVDFLDDLTGKVLMAGRINADSSVRAAANGNMDVPDFPPSDLKVITVSARQLDLSWTDNASDETGARIERATNAGGPYSQVGTVAANVESYADGTVNDLTTYYYRVRAFNAAGETASSNIDSATTPFAAPDNLLVIAVSSNRIDLFWADNSSGESGYRIERKTGPAGIYSQMATVSPNVDTFKDTGLKASTTYFYRVRAYDDDGVSPYSNEASAETNAVLTASNVSPAGEGGGGGGGCFISAAGYSIWSIFWLFLLPFIPAGCAVYLKTKRTP